MPSLARFPSRDTYLDSANPAVNQGTNTGTNNGVLNSKGVPLYHGLYMFDFGGVVGIGATVTQSSFGFYVNSTAGAGGAQHSLNRIVPARQNWTELGATWNTYDGVNAWTTPGGDFDAIVPPFVWVPPASGGPFVLAGGATLTALIQDAINNWNGQLHVLWKQITEAGPPANSLTVSIATKEDITLPPSHWPIMSIQYTAPASKAQQQYLNVTGDMPDTEFLSQSAHEFIDWP